MTVDTKTDIWAIVPAAGIGARMQSEVPKQYLRIGQHTVLDITIQKLLQVDAIKGIVLALHPDDQWWPQSQYSSHPKIHVTTGGKERSDSVALCLVHLLRELKGSGDNENIWALVHDAARPCVSVSNICSLIEKGISEQQNMDGCILASPSADTVKRVSGTTIEKTEDRSQLWLAHTPQFFPALRLLQSIEAAASKNTPITDEASAIEACGGSVSVLQDRRDNIKITVPEDLQWAEMILHQQSEEQVPLSKNVGESTK